MNETNRNESKRGETKCYKMNREGIYSKMRIEKCPFRKGYRFIVILRARFRTFDHRLCIVSAFIIWKIFSQSHEWLDAFRRLSFIEKRIQNERK